MMKKLSALLLALLLVFSVSIADDFDDMISSASNQDLIDMWNKIAQEMNKRGIQAPDENQILLECEIEGCHIILDRIWLTKENNGNPSLGVHFLYSNPSSEEKWFMYTVDCVGTQNGINLKRARFTEDADTSTSMIKIKDGEQIDVYWAYVLNDTSSPITITLYDMQKNEFASGTFDIPQ